MQYICFSIFGYIFTSKGAAARIAISAFLPDIRDNTAYNGAAELQLYTIFGMLGSYICKVLGVQERIKNGMKIF